MQLADEFAHIADRFYGRVREIKLNQAAIDCLAIIAYRPGIHARRNRPAARAACSAIVNQLVRRQLVEVKREQTKKSRVTRTIPPNACSSWLVWNRSTKCHWQRFRVKRTLGRFVVRMPELRCTREKDLAKLACLEENFGLPT